MDQVVDPIAHLRLNFVIRYTSMCNNCLGLPILNIPCLIGMGQVGPKDHQRFQSSYATILKARMTALKKRERKDKKKAADSDKKQDTKKHAKTLN